jgi:hypothetical protein
VVQRYTFGWGRGGAKERTRLDGHEPSAWGLRFITLSTVTDPPSPSIVICPAQLAASSFPPSKPGNPYNLYTHTYLVRQLPLKLYLGVLLDVFIQKVRYASLYETRQRETSTTATTCLTRIPLLVDLSLLSPSCILSFKGWPIMYVFLTPPSSLLHIHTTNHRQVAQSTSSSLTLSLSWSGHH